MPGWVSQRQPWALDPCATEWHLMEPASNLSVRHFTRAVSGTLEHATALSLLPVLREHSEIAGTCHCATLPIFLWPSFSQRWDYLA